MFLIFNQIRLVFEGHGTIVEVVLLKDKRTGSRQGTHVELLTVISLVYITTSFCNLAFEGLWGVMSLT